MLPKYSIIYDGNCDDSGIDKNIYIEKIRQHREKNLAKLRELDITLAEDLPAYPHQSMEMGLDSRRKAKFNNAKWSDKNMEDMDTPIAAAEKMLVGGVQNSVEEFVFALSSKIEDMNEEETVIECTPVSGGCEVLVVIPTEETLDENIIERMFRRYVIEKPIEHPYKIPWQRTSNRAKVKYQPSIKLDNIYVEADGSTLVITASVKFTFE